MESAIAFLTTAAPVVKPPTTANSIHNFPPAQIRSDALSTNILVHPRFSDLLSVFLTHKRQHGSKYERALYNDNFTWKDLVSRLITKRPLTFVGPLDYTLLRDGTTITKACDEWDRIGTEEQDQNQYLTLDEYLSYDEIMLSSLVGVSGPSFFTNDGNRYNKGRPDKEGMFQERGVIIGLVGSRFERPGRMDSVHMLPTDDECRRLNDMTLAGIVQEWVLGRKKNEGVDLDVEMYKARTKITADMLLLEANARAKGEERKAWVYVVGLGLGVWQYYHQQREWYLDAFAKSLEQLDLKYVSTVEFAWIKVDSEEIPRHLQAIGRKKGINVVFSKRNPAEKLTTDELLVLSYAWDGNAFPGNEYWQGSVDGSGDPAAACMSTIPELHNPLVNPFTGRIRIAGDS